MTQNNPTNVLAAFEMLLEEIENELEFVNRAGAGAFQEGDYEKVDQVRAQAGRITDYRSKLAAMRKEWQQLSQQFNLDEEGDDEAVSERRNMGRLRRGVRTPEEAFMRPVLTALVKLGGAGSTGDVLEEVYIIMKETLNDVDHEPLPSTGQMRWRNTAQWARNTLVQQGLMRDDSKRGTWEISEEGRQFLGRV